MRKEPYFNHTGGGHYQYTDDVVTYASVWDDPNNEQFHVYVYLNPQMAKSFATKEEAFAFVEAIMALDT